MFISAEHSKSQDTSRNMIVDADAEKRLVRKIDLYLMPSIFILYLFSYMVWYLDLAITNYIPLKVLCRIDQTLALRKSPEWKRICTSHHINTIQP